MLFVYYLLAINLGAWQITNMITVQTRINAIFASLDWTADWSFLWATIRARLKESFNLKEIKGKKPRWIKTFFYNSKKLQ